MNVPALISDGTGGARTRAVSGYHRLDQKEV
jgi:hypothetical protein